MPSGWKCDSAMNPQQSRSSRPTVGLLNNPAVQGIIDAAGSLVERVAVMPDRLWFDLGLEVGQAVSTRRT